MFFIKEKVLIVLNLEEVSPLQKNKKQKTSALVVKLAFFDQLFKDIDKVFDKLKSL